MCVNIEPPRKVANLFLLIINEIYSYNFEIEDALQKLERWNLVNRDGHIIRGKNMTYAMQQLDKIWDNYFLYHKADEPAG